MVAIHRFTVEGFLHLSVPRYFMMFSRYRLVGTQIIVSLFLLHFFQLIRFCYNYKIVQPLALNRFYTIRLLRPLETLILLHIFSMQTEMFILFINRSRLHEIS